MLNSDFGNCFLTFGGKATKVFEAINYLFENVLQNETLIVELPVSESLASQVVIHGKNLLNYRISSPEVLWL
jgi:hypothetical protein